MPRSASISSISRLLIGERQYQRTAHRITSPWKWRHLKSFIVPSVQSPPSMLTLHDFCHRAGAVTLVALMLILIDIGCQPGQRDFVDHFPVRSPVPLTIARPHVCTPLTTAHFFCRLLLV